MAILTLEKQNEGVAILWMDDTKDAVNTLKQELMDEFDKALSEIEQSDEIKTLVFASGKPDSFVAGADISMLQRVTTAEQAAELSRQLQEMTNRIAKLKANTVAAIHGACLGGGLELAMAFDKRVATTHRKTKLGLPEVQLGLLPGGGGTQRLPRLVSITTALDMMLTGKQLNGKRALRAGLVDDVVAPDILLEVAIKLANSKARKRKISLVEKFMSSPLGRPIVFNQARKQTLSKTKGHYPSPEKILDIVELGLSNGMTKGLQAEAEGFGELVVSPQAEQLIKLFFATNDLKKDTGVDKKVDIRETNKIGVLGAGLMGSGISYVSMQKAGVQVRLKDLNAEGLGRGVAYVGKLLDKQLKRRRISSLRRNQIRSKLTTTTDYRGFNNTDIVIEAVFEDLKVKQSMVSDVESLKQDKEIIFATNTSAIPIDQIAAKAKHPERVIGMHYFSPVEKMPLLEIITGSKTADWVTASCVEFGKQQGKTVIVVNDGPGFYTTRILVPYIMEGIHMITEGVSIEDVDQALVDFGFPVGPIVLLDEVGIDVGDHIVDTLHQSFGERATPIPAMSRVIVDERKGRKNKKGFYDYSSNSKVKKVDKSIYQVMEVNNPGSKTIAPENIAERCVLMMLNEAAYCYGEKILRSARDGDIGAIFGLGFPPFLGGPFRYADNMGIQQVIDKLEALKTEHGERFTPAPILFELAKSDKHFY